MTAITPLQALRRLVDIARLIDADECPEFYNQLQGELVVAGAVLAEPQQDIHCQEFHELAMNYRGALNWGVVNQHYKALCDYINERIAPSAAEPSEADEGKILAEFNTWFGPVVDDSNANNQAIHFWAQEAYRAGRLGLADAHSSKKQEPVAYLRFWASQKSGGSQNNDIDYAEGLEVCEKGDIGTDKLSAFPVYSAPIAAQSAKQADDFAHFLSYSGLSAESEEVKEKLQRAFEAGQPSSTVERFWNAVERQQYAQPAALNAKLVAALRDMVVWFGQYPDLVPDESHYDKYRAAIDNARFVLVAYGMK